MLFAGSYFGGNRRNFSHDSFDVEGGLPVLLKFKHICIVFDHSLKNAHGPVELSHHGVKRLDLLKVDALFLFCELLGGYILGFLDEGVKLQGVDAAVLFVLDPFESIEVVVGIYKRESYFVHHALADLIHGIRKFLQLLFQLLKIVVVGFLEAWALRLDPLGENELPLQSLQLLEAQYLMGMDARGT